MIKSNFRLRTDLGDIQPSGTHISGNKTLDFSVSEGLHSDFPLILRNVSMEDCCLLVNFSLEQNVISLDFNRVPFVWSQ
jgi:hypothetical protein